VIIRKIRRKSMHESKFHMRCAVMVSISIIERLDRMASRKEPDRIERARFLIKWSMIRIAPSEMKIAAMTGIFHSISLFYHVAERKKRDFL